MYLTYILRILGSGLIFFNIFGLIRSLAMFIGIILAILEQGISFTLLLAILEEPFMAGVFIGTLLGPILMISLGVFLIQESWNQERKNRRIRFKDENQTSYFCPFCNYEYDPLVGDPDRGIKRFTAFKDIEKDWFCPIFETSKQDFRP